MFLENLKLEKGNMVLDLVDMHLLIKQQRNKGAEGAAGRRRRKGMIGGERSQ